MCQTCTKQSSMEEHNYVSYYRRALALEVPGWKWTTPSKMIGSDRAQILRGFQFLIDKKAMANQPDVSQNVWVNVLFLVSLICFFVLSFMFKGSFNLCSWFCSVDFQVSSVNFYDKFPSICKWFLFYYGGSLPARVTSWFMFPACDHLTPVTCVPLSAPLWHVQWSPPSLFI